ncbi:glycosyltransferase family 4 protein [Chrysosporum bergii ANA360D]|jgi:glycosyltransferase involved in cell wall biosynthesis|uniref:Glycosyltransferase family 4 protein n=1 Tax=Chrysosporum bergii ANA360D TaxID=617107 RepID=A0AA43GSJ6_9CYAN|nr:glycosyltransferase family 4 protein [Chrysosporum bergii]MDH6060123.1 glycosyltransferase family 4 protein [Chrysosporum bergii ANA360D]
MESLKLLISAYACEPNRGSEPGVGWNVIQEVSKYHQVWVLTSNCHRQGIEAYLAQHPLPNINFVYLDPLGWILNWNNPNKVTQLGVHLHYYLWQILAYFVSRSLHQQICFDVAHHVTYVRYYSPSFISLLPIPFIWGPVGGGESAPKKFWEGFSLRAKAYETARYLFRSWGELDPFVHITGKKSAVVRATTNDTAKRLEKMGVKNVQVYSQLGLSSDEIATLASYRADGRVNNSRIRFISVGRLLYWKGFDLGLSAFAQAELPHADFWIVGDGPERKQLEQLTEALSIGGRVKFWGNLSREQTWEKIQDCHVLVHPSLHDSGGFVCLEAMAAACPIICLDLGGPAIQVTEDIGVKISAHTPEQVIGDIAKAMNYLASDGDLRLRMGGNGQQRVNEAFSWESKGRQLVQMYEEISTQNTFPMKLS